MRSSTLLQMPLSSSLAETIAIRARGTPRIANNLLRWVRDYHQMHPKEPLSNPLIAKALDLLGIDHRGLDEMDKMILKTIIEHHKGGPVGVQTLSVALGEESHTIAEVYEPYLIMSGFLERTPRGRVATSLAYQHIGLKSPENNFGE
jgi:Holliday junction DNA helicase RuvB